MPVQSKMRPRRGSSPAAESPRLAFIPFQFPTLVDAPPAGNGWIHEIKQDGYRTELVLDRGNARAFSRRGLDWTEAAYRRGDLLAKRQQLMAAWAAFATGGGRVVHLARTGGRL